MKARICVSILPKTMAEALQLIEKTEESNADLIEVRLDHLENLDEIAKVAAHGKTPKIATDKSSRPQTEQRKMLLTAAKNGFEYVDVVAIQSGAVGGCRRGFPIGHQGQGQ